MWGPGVGRGTSLGQSAHHPGQVRAGTPHPAAQEARQEGFTHDWMVFVRGPEQCEIQHFVEKVIFRLHDSFPKPKRVCKERPYEVEESGYAGFLMRIEVYFKNKM